MTDLCGDGVLMSGFRKRTFLPSLKAIH